MYNSQTIASDIIAINLDSVASPSINANILKYSSNDHTSWGLGWYPHDREVTTIIKEHSAKFDQVLNEITDWENFRSTTFFYKIRNVVKKKNHIETQPFSYNFAGKDWMFMHSGYLDKQNLESIYKINKNPFKPGANIDSELALCHLLFQIQKLNVKSIAEIAPKILYSWFNEFDLIGCADMYFTDGDSIVCFHGSQSTKKMNYIRIQPPNNQDIYNSVSSRISIDDPRDSYRTAIIVSSSLFSEGSWTEMLPGQMIIIKRGAIIYDSLLNNFTETEYIHKSDNIKETQTQNKELTLNTRSITNTIDGKTLGYMLYDINHITIYDYTIPVEHSTHTFHLQPTEDHIQEIIYSKLTISSTTKELQFEDVFGNRVVHCVIDKPYSRLQIESNSRIKVYATIPDSYELSLRHNSIPLVWMPWQRQMMSPYLLPTEIPESQFIELTEYAMSFVERNDYNLIKTIEDINTSIYKDYKYVTGSTSLNTTAFEVYTSRQGVCQDFANLFICLARLLGIPARYRMGYIYTGYDHVNNIQSNASHAWVELYLPYIGWRGFDPTNGCIVEQDHVRVSCGRNYIDTAPTSGTIYRGGGYESLVTNVKMVRVQ